MEAEVPQVWIYLNSRQAQIIFDLLTWKVEDTQAKAEEEVGNMRWRMDHLAKETQQLRDELKEATQGTDEQ